VTVALMVAEAFRMLQSFSRMAADEEITRGT
jgi:hypothetical protein